MDVLVWVGWTEDFECMHERGLTQMVCRINPWFLICQRFCWLGSQWRLENVEFGFYTWRVILGFVQNMVFVISRSASLTIFSFIRTAQVAARKVSFGMVRPLPLMGVNRIFPWWTWRELCCSTIWLVSMLPNRSLDEASVNTRNFMPSTLLWWNCSHFGMQILGRFASCSFHFCHLISTLTCSNLFFLPLLL